MDDRSPILEARRITFGYGREIVLEEVDLAIGQRDFLAIIGPNGGGKTTLLKLMLGLLEPWSGEVVRRMANRRGAIGYVPQFAGFEKSFPLRVSEVVAMGRLGRRPGPRRFNAADRRRVDEELRRLGLRAAAGAAIGDLSGGQLQRALIARALAGEPEILFLDEPLGSLDAESRTVVLETLSELNRRIPVVVVTHDVTLFAERARQIACLNRRLHYHPGGQVTPEMLEKVYGCPVELVAHGVPHRVLPDHPESPEATSRWKP